MLCGNISNRILINTEPRCCEYWVNLEEETEDSCNFHLRWYTFPSSSPFIEIRGHYYHQHHRIQCNADFRGLHDGGCSHLQ